MKQVILKELCYFCTIQRATNYMTILKQKHLTVESHESKNLKLLKLTLSFSTWDERQQYTTPLLSL